jgi:hypothetical protein
MAAFREPIVLGRTGLRVGRLGIASGMARREAIEEASRARRNYFHLGHGHHGYNPRMREALKNIVAKGQRDRLVLAAFSYAHSNFHRRTLRRGLKSAGLTMPMSSSSLLPAMPRRLVDGALRMKEKGLSASSACPATTASFGNDWPRQGKFDVSISPAAHRGAEQIFPFLKGERRPGTVSFTATRWGQLLNAKKMPPGEKPATAVDCYRFVLSHPAVDVCMTGARTLEQMRENLAVFDSGPMSEDELARMRRIGDHVHGRKRG